MATNLHTLTTAQLAELTDASASVATALAAARDELDRRDPSPAPVAELDKWLTDCGAAQHLKVVSAALSENRAEQERARRELATVSNPADAETGENELRALMITEAALRLEVRSATKRKATATSEVESIAALQERINQEIQGATDLVEWAVTHTQRASQLRAAIASAEIAAIAGQASTTLTSAERTAADDRLTALVPAKLRARAAARATEAVALLTDAENHADVAVDGVNTLKAASWPIDARVELATRELLAAEDGLDSYVTNAVSRLERAGELYESVSQHRDLTSAQVAALDETENPDGASAIDSETDLAAAIAALDGKQRDLADAILNAQTTDIDADLAADSDISDANDAIADASIQDPLDTHRPAYETNRAALDAWEVEVPPTLWQALLDFAAAEQTLTDLADAADRDALSDALDLSEDDLAGAVETRNTALRTLWQAELTAAQRSSVATGLRETAPPRMQQYLQGDGPGGRTPDQL